MQTLVKFFLKSKTYKIIQNAGEEFYEDEAEQFYELCKNECKYGQPIENRDIIKKWIRKGVDIYEGIYTSRFYRGYNSRGD